DSLLETQSTAVYIIPYATLFRAPPLDPEDLALSPDGKTLWIADIGDNATAKQRRSRIALWSMPVDGSKPPVIHRVSYPGNEPRRSEEHTSELQSRENLVCRLLLE